MESKPKHPGPRKQVDPSELKRLLEEVGSLRRIATDLKCGCGTVRRAAQALDHGKDEPKLPEVSQNPAA